MAVLASVKDYTKNIMKSAVYASNDVVKDLMPGYSDFTDTNKEVFKEAYVAVKDFRRTIARIGDAITKSKIYEAADTAFENAKYDLKHGTFYNQARTKAAEEKAMDSFGGGDFDMGGGDSGGGDFGLNLDDSTGMDDIDKMLGIGSEGEDEFSNISEGDALVAKSVKQSTAAGASLIANTQIKSAEAIMKSNKISTSILYAQNEKLMGVTQTGFSMLNETAGNILTFNKEAMQSHFENSKKFFESQDKLGSERNAMLKEMLEMQRNLYKLRVGEEEDKEKEKKKKLRFGDISTSEGHVDIANYWENIKGNFGNVLENSGLGMLKNMSDMGLGDNPLLLFAQNPLGGIMTGLVGAMIGPRLQETSKNFDKTLSNIFGNFIARMNSMAKEDEMSITGMIGQLLGVRDTVKSSLDSDTYKKGPVPWDGEARQALVKVIPEYLASIDATLSGRPHRVYDYERGYFVNSRDLREQWNSQSDRYLAQATGDVNREVLKYLGSIRRDNEKDNIDQYKTLENFWKAMWADPGKFQKAAIYANRYLGNGPRREERESDTEFFDDLVMDIGAGFNGEEYVKNILMALNSIGSVKGGTQKLGSTAANIMNARTNLNRERENIQEKGLTPFMSLFDGSYEERIDKKYGNVISDKNSIMNKMSLLEQKDLDGKNVYFYLKEALSELVAIRTWGTGIGKSKEERAINDKRKRRRPASIGVGTSTSNPKLISVQGTNVRDLKGDYRTAKEKYDDSERRAEERYKQKRDEEIQKFKDKKTKSSNYKYLLEKNSTSFQGNDLDKRIAEIYESEEQRMEIVATQYADIAAKMQKAVEESEESQKTYFGKLWGDFKDDNKKKRSQQWDDIKEKGFLQTLSDASTLGAKFGVFKVGLEQLAEKPTAFIDNIMRQADERIYKFFFLEETKVDKEGNEVHGFFGRMRVELDEVFEKINEGLNKHLIDPLKEKLGVEGPWDAVKKGLNYMFNIDVDDITDSIKDSVGNVFSPIKDRLVEMGENFWEDAKQEIEEERRKARELLGIKEAEETTTTSGSGGETSSKSKTEEEKTRDQLASMESKIDSLMKEGRFQEADALKERKEKYEQLKAGTLDTSQFSEKSRNRINSINAINRSSGFGGVLNASEVSYTLRDIESIKDFSKKESIDKIREAEKIINEKGTEADKIRFYQFLINNRNRMTKKDFDIETNRLNIMNQNYDDLNNILQDQGINLSEDEFNAIRDSRRNRLEDINKLSEKLKTSLEASIFDEFESKLKSIVTNKVNAGFKQAEEDQAKANSTETKIKNRYVGEDAQNKALDQYKAWMNISSKFEKGNFEIGDQSTRTIRRYDLKRDDKGNLIKDKNGNYIKDMGSYKDIVVNGLNDFIYNNKDIVFDSYASYIDKFLYDKLFIDNEDDRKAIIKDLRNRFINNDSSTIQSFIDVKELRKSIIRYKRKSNAEFEKTAFKSDEERDKRDKEIANIEEAHRQLLGQEGAFYDDKFKDGVKSLEFGRTFGQDISSDTPDFERSFDQSTTKIGGFFTDLKTALEDKLDKVIDSIQSLTSPSPILGRVASGGTVPETGLYVLSKGEAVIPRSFDPGEIAKDSKKEQAYVNSIADKVSLKIKGRYAGGTVTAKKFKTLDDSDKGMLKVLNDNNVKNVIDLATAVKMMRENPELAKEAQEHMDAVIAFAKQDEKYSNYRLDTDSGKIEMMRDFMKNLSESQEGNTRKGIKIGDFNYKFDDLKGATKEYGKELIKTRAREAKEFWSNSTLAKWIHEGFDNIKEGASDIVGELFGKESKQIQEASKETMNTVKDAFPDIAAHGILGAVGGMVIGGPLVGALLGSAIGVVKNNEGFMTSIFGEKYTEGEKAGRRKGGIIDEETQELFYKYAPSMRNLGIAGGLVGLFTPFGPLGGALIGAGLGAVRENEDFQEMMYGPKDANGERDNGIINKKTRDFFKKAMPNAAVAAIGMAALGPFGLVGNLALGAGLGLYGSTEAFKTHLFGAEDENGKRKGGLVGALRKGVIEPWLAFGKNVKDDLYEWIKTDVFAPLKNGLQPIAKQIQLAVTGAFTGVGRFINRFFEVTTGIPLAKTVEERILKPLSKFGTTIIGGLLKPVKAIASAPFKAFGMLGEGLKRRQIMRGTADYMTAGQRLEAREKAGIKGDQYEAFDQIISTTGKENLSTLIDSLSIYNNGEKGLKQAQGRAMRGTFATIDNTFGERVGYGIKQKIQELLLNKDVDGAIELIERAGSDLKDSERKKIIEEIKSAHNKLMRADDSLATFNQSKEEMGRYLSDIIGIDVNEDNASKILNNLKYELSARNKTEQNEKDGKTSEAESAITNTIADPINESAEYLKKIFEIMKERKEGLISPDQEFTERYMNRKWDKSIGRVDANIIDNRKTIREGFKDFGIDENALTDELVDFFTSKDGAKIYNNLQLRRKEGLKLNERTLADMVNQDPKTIARFISLFDRSGLQTNDFKELSSLDDKQFENIIAAKAQGLDVRNLSEFKDMDVSYSEKFADIKKRTGLNEDYLTPDIVARIIDSGLYATMVNDGQNHQIDPEDLKNKLSHGEKNVEDTKYTKGSDIGKIHSKRNYTLDAILNTFAPNTLRSIPALGNLGIEAMNKGYIPGMKALREIETPKLRGSLTNEGYSKAFDVADTKPSDIKEEVKYFTEDGVQKAKGVESGKVWIIERGLWREAEVPSYAKGGIIPNDQLAILSKGETVIKPTDINKIPKYAAGTVGNLALATDDLTEANQTPAEVENKPKKQATVTDINEYRKKKEAKEKTNAEADDAKEEATKNTTFMERMLNKIEDVKSKMSDAKAKMSNRVKETVGEFGIMRWRKSQDGSNMPYDKDTKEAQDKINKRFKSDLQMSDNTTTIVNILRDWKNKAFAKVEEKKKKNPLDSILDMLSKLKDWFMSGGLLGLLKKLLGMIPKIPGVGAALTALSGLKDTIVKNLKDFWRGLKGERGVIPKVRGAASKAAKATKGGIIAKLASVGIGKKLDAYAGKIDPKSTGNNAFQRVGSLGVTEEERAYVKALKGHSGKFKFGNDFTVKAKDIATKLGIAEDEVFTRINNLTTKINDPKYKLPSLNITALDSSAEHGIANIAEQAKRYEKISNLDEMIKKAYAPEFMQIEELKKLNKLRMMTADEHAAANLFEKMSLNRGELDPRSKKYMEKLIERHPEFKERYEFMKELYTPGKWQLREEKLRDFTRTQIASAKGSVNAGLEMTRDSKFVSKILGNTERTLLSAEELAERRANLIAAYPDGHGEKLYNDLVEKQNKLRRGMILNAKDTVSNKVTSAIDKAKDKASNLKNRMLGNTAAEELEFLRSRYLTEQAMTAAEADKAVRKYNYSNRNVFGKIIGAPERAREAIADATREARLRIADTANAAKRTVPGRIVTGAAEVYTAPYRAMWNGVKGIDKAATFATDQIRSGYKAVTEIGAGIDAQLAQSLGKGYKVASFVPKMMLQAPGWAMEGIADTASIIRGGVTGNLNKVGQGMMEVAEAGPKFLGKTVEEGASAAQKAGFAVGKGAEWATSKIFNIVMKPVEIVAGLTGKLIGTLPGAKPDKIAGAFEKFAKGLGAIIAKKAGAAAIVKALGKLVPFVGNALLAKDLVTAFYDGLTNPGLVLGINDQDSISQGERVMAAVCNALVSVCTLGILEGKDVIDFAIQTIGPAIGFNPNGLKERQDMSKAELDAYNKKYGTQLTQKEFMKVRGQLNEKGVLDNVMDAGKFIAGEVVDWVKALPGAILDGVKNLATGAFNIAADIGGIKSYWDKLYDRAQAIAWNDAGPEEIAQWNQQIQIDPNERFAGIKQMMKDFATQHFFLMSTGGFVVSKVLDVTKSAFSGIGNAIGMLGQTASKIGTAVIEGHPLDVITAGYDAYQTSGYQGFGGTIGAIAGTLMSGFAVTPALFVKLGRFAYDTITGTFDSLNRIPETESFANTMGKAAEKGNLFEVIETPNPFTDDDSVGGYFATGLFYGYKVFSSFSAMWHKVANSGFSILEWIGNIGDNKFDPKFYDEFDPKSWDDIMKFWDHSEIEFDTSKPMSIFGSFADSAYKLFKMPGKVMTWLGHKLFDGEGGFLSDGMSIINKVKNWWNNSDAKSKETSTDANTIDRNLKERQKTSDQRVAEAKKLQEAIDKAKDEATKEKLQAELKKKVEAMEPDEINKVTKNSTYLSESTLKEIQAGKAKKIFEENNYEAMINDLYEDKPEERDSWQGERKAGVLTDTNKEIIRNNYKSKYGLGSHRFGMGINYSQNNPIISQIPFMRDKDTDYMTISDRACGPMSMASAATAATGMGVNPLEMVEDVKDSELEANGGTKFDYFKRKGSEFGLTTEQSSSHDKLYDQIKSGKPTILMGTSNKESSPFGPNPHYVTATGTTPDGNIIVQNPENDRSDVVYDKNIVNEASVGFSFGKGTKKSKYGRNIFSAIGKEIVGNNAIDSIGGTAGGIISAVDNVMDLVSPAAWYTWAIQNAAENSGVYDTEEDKYRKAIEAGYGAGSKKSKYGKGPDEDPPFASIAAGLADRLGSKHPELFWAQLMHETGGPEKYKSDVQEYVIPKIGVDDHNYGGFTWYSGMGEERKGVPRPANEGGYYAKFLSDQDYVDRTAKDVFSFYKDEIASASTPEEFAAITKSHGYYAGDEYSYASGLRGALEGPYKDKLSKIPGATLQGGSNLDTTVGGNTKSGSSSGGTGMFGGGMIGSMLAKAFSPLVSMHAKLFGGNEGGSTAPAAAGANAVNKINNGGSGLANIVETNLSFNGTAQPLGEVKHISIHHTGPSGTYTPEQEATIDWDAKKIHEFHKTASGLDGRGIGYHFVIRKNGTIERGRPENELGCHTYKNNTGTLGIHVSGHFGFGNPTEAQLSSLAKLLADLCAKYNLNCDRDTIRGHREFPENEGATECPGDNMIAVLDDVVKKAASMKSTSTVGKGSGKYKFGKGNTAEFNNLKNTIDSQIDYLTKEDKKDVIHPKKTIISVFGKGSGKHKFGKGRSTPEMSQEMWNYMKSKGLSAKVVAGIMGNFKAESSLYSDRLQNHDPDNGSMTAPVDGVTGYGLAQWTSSDRQQRLKDYASSVGQEDGDWKTQIDFILSGSDGNVKDMFTSMDNSASPSEAAIIFHDEFERSADDAQKKQRRGTFAEEYFNNEGKGVNDSNSFSGGTSSSSSGGAISGALGGMFGGGLIGATLSKFFTTDPQAKAMIDQAMKLGLMSVPTSTSSGGTSSSGGSGTATSGQVTGDGNTMKIDAQTGSNCTVESTRTMLRAYTGEEPAKHDDEFSWWNPQLEGTLQGTWHEFGNSDADRTQFEGFISDHFKRKPGNPLFMYQTGGAGRSGGHPINAGSGKHATVIGRKLANGKYEHYDSAGGVVKEFDLQDFFDPTAMGHDQGMTGGNALLEPGIDPSRPIANWQGGGQTAQAGMGSGKYKFGRGDNPLVKQDALNTERITKLGPVTKTTFELPQLNLRPRIKSTPSVFRLYNERYDENDNIKGYNGLKDNLIDPNNDTTAIIEAKKKAQLKWLEGKKSEESKLIAKINQYKFEAPSNKIDKKDDTLSTIEKDQSPKYEYDENGNIKGYDGIKDNLIDPNNDTTMIIEAKKKAQFEYMEKKRKEKEKNTKIPNNKIEVKDKDIKEKGELKEKGLAPEIAPNGEHYEENDILYLMNNGETRESAILILSKIDKYTKVKEKKDKKINTIQEMMERINQKIKESFEKMGIDSPIPTDIVPKPENKILINTTTETEDNKEETTEKKVNSTYLNTTYDKPKTDEEVLEEKKDIESEKKVASTYLNKDNAYKENADKIEENKDKILEKVIEADKAAKIAEAENTISEQAKEPITAATTQTNTTNNTNNDISSQILNALLTIANNTTQMVQALGNAGNTVNINRAGDTVLNSNTTNNSIPNQPMIPGVEALAGALMKMASR